MFETTPEHLERHNYPSQVRHCHRCFWAHNQKQWERQCVFQDNRTGETLVWLQETANPMKQVWGLGCILCRNAGIKNTFARFRASAKLSNILRHGNHTEKHAAGAEAKTADHEKALTMWGTKKQTGTKPAGDPPPPCAITYAHVIFNRTLIETGGSFQDFGRWAKAARLAGADIGFGAVSNRVGKQLAEAMAEREIDVNQKLMTSASAVGLAEDARGHCLAVRMSMVLWTWPRGLRRPRGRLPHGVESLNGGRAPWVVDRLAALGQLGSDHSAAAKGHITTNAVARTSTDDGQHAKDAINFFVSDHASDETLTAKIVHKSFPNMNFVLGDESHSIQLVMKNVLCTDEEVLTVCHRK